MSQKEVALMENRSAVARIKGNLGCGGQLIVEEVGEKGASGMELAQKDQEHFVRYFFDRSFFCDINNYTIYNGPWGKIIQLGTINLE